MVLDRTALEVIEGRVEAYTSSVTSTLTRLSIFLEWPLTTTMHQDLWMQDPENMLRQDLTSMSLLAIVRLRNASIQTNLLELAIHVRHPYPSYPSSSSWILARTPNPSSLVSSTIIQQSAAETSSWSLAS